jgi:hypothetical protein
MSWGSSLDEARRVLKSTVIPALRERGFTGSFPHFSRRHEERIDLLSFQFSQFGPDLYIEIASGKPHGAKLSDGSVISSAKMRTYHAGLMRRRIGPQPALAFADVEDPAAASHFIRQVMTAIEQEGEPWWSAPSPIVCQASEPS